MKAAVCLSTREYMLSAEYDRTIRDPLNGKCGGKISFTEISFENLTKQKGWNKFAAVIIICSKEMNDLINEKEASVKHIPPDKIILVRRIDGSSSTLSALPNIVTDTLDRQPQGADATPGGQPQGTDENAGGQPQGTDENAGGQPQGADEAAGGQPQGTEENADGQQHETTAVVDFPTVFSNIAEDMKKTIYSEDKDPFKQLWLTLSSKVRKMEFAQKRQSNTGKK